MDVEVALVLTSRPEITDAVTRGAARVLLDLGYASLAEVVLPNGRRADMMAIDGRGGLTIVEIKVSRADLRGDGKWPDYLDYCDRFYWAVPGGFALDLFDTEDFRPEVAGLIVADRYDAAVIREPAHRPLAPARRKAETLRFARRAARRLAGDIDPDLAGY